MADFDDLPQRAFAPRLTRMQGDVEDPYSTADILGQMNKPETFPDWLKRQADKIPESGRHLAPRGADESLFSYWKRAADALSIPDMAKGGVNTVANWFGATKGTDQTAQPGEGYGFAATGLGPSDTLAPLGAAPMGMALTPRNAVGMFGGRLAQTADHAALAKAEEMAARGLSRDDIWKDTGWFQGVDGKWRFEIDDSKSRLGPMAEKELTAGGDHGATQRTARGFLQHPDMYEAYPRLMGVDVDARYNKGLGQGSASGEYLAHAEGNGGRPKINMSTDTLEGEWGPRSVGLHEFQHGIQDAEGFAKGGGKTLTSDERSNLIREVMEYSRPADEARGVPWRDSWDNAARYVDSNAGRLAAYRRIAGEVEARNVQTRMDMSPEERRATPPWKTQDVPDEQQIVRMGGSGPQMSSSLPMDEASRGTRQPPIVQFRKDAASIESSLPPVAQGYTRLWRGGRPGEQGSTSFTSDLPGIALPFSKAYGGGVSYVDVRSADMPKYARDPAGGSTSVEFSVTPDIARTARQVLPMDEASRMNRAREMGVSPEELRLYDARQAGFNTDRSFYHLTNRDFDEFSVNADPGSHSGGGAIWFRTDPRGNVAAHQTEFDTPGAREIPAFLRMNKAVPTSEYDNLNPNFPVIVTKDEGDRLRAAGYTHAETRDGREVAVFDPKNIRSKYADFNPLDSDKAGLLLSKNDSPVGTVINAIGESRGGAFGKNVDFTPTNDLRMFELKGGKADMGYTVEPDGTVFAQTLQSHAGERGSGLGSKVLDEFLQSTDAAGRRVVLDAITVPLMGSKGLSQDALEKFYERRGFVKQPTREHPFRMVREPIGESQLPERAFGHANASTRPDTGLGHPTAVQGAVRAYRGVNVGNQFGPHPDYGTPNIVWATSHPGVASEFADSGPKSALTSPAVYPVDIDFKNPFTVDARRQVEHLDDMAEQAMAKGHDGMIVNNVRDTPDMRDDAPLSTVYAALRPNTVRSATTGETLFSKNDNQIGTAINALGEAQASGLKKQESSAFGLGHPDSVPGAFGDKPDLSKIVNPIDPRASTAEKLRQIQVLTQENAPILEEFTRGIDARLGTESKVSIKDPEKIAEKAKRPSILAEKPWHDVEHIRDTLRFKTVVDHFDQIGQAVRELPEGFSVVKKDTEKLFAPKEWGFPIVAFDLRAKNGQLLEWYQPLREVEAAKKEGHVIFERWRNLSKEEVNANYAAFLDDIRASNKLYSDALLKAVRRMGFGDLTDARASWDKLSASLPESTEKFSYKSMGSKGVPAPASDHFPSAFRANTNSPSATSARPSSESSMASRLDTGSPSYSEKWRIPERAFKPSK